MKQFLGMLDNVESYYLTSPSFDCEWYVGFGYIGNSQIHTHLDHILNETGQNWYDAMKTVFKGGLSAKLQDDKTLWQFCDLMKTFYTLKDAYEVYHSGNSHYTSIPDLNLKNVKIATQIMKDIFRVCNKVCEIMDLTKLQWNNEIERKVAFGVMPTIFERNEKPIDGKEFTLVYLSPYDNKTVKDYKEKYVISKALRT